jgi:hypothetical protein
MKLQVDFAHGDIAIRRVSNGWVVYSGSEYEEDHFITAVYEDPEYGEAAESNSLLHLIQEQFDSYIQTKKRGGIKLEVREKGYSYEEDEEVEKEFVDYGAIGAWPPQLYCDVCGRPLDEYEIAPTGQHRTGFVCAGKMKESCQNISYEEENEG